MRQSKPRLIVPLLAVTFAIVSSIAVLRAKAGPDVAADVSLSQPMSGPELGTVQSFLGSPQGTSFISGHPGAEGLLKLTGSADDLQALGSLGHELASGKDVPAAYEAAVHQALAELDARTSRAARAVADGSAAPESLDAAAKSLSAYRVYGAAAAAKVNALSAAARQARAQGHAQQVAQQLLGSLRSGVDVANAGAPAVSAQAADAESAKAGAAVRREARLGKGSVPVVSARSSGVDQAGSRGSLLGGKASARQGSPVGPIGPIGRLRHALVGLAASAFAFAPSLASAYTSWDEPAYRSVSQAVSSEPSAGAFFLLWAAVIGGLALLMRGVGALIGRLPGVGRVFMYSAGALGGAVLLPVFSSLFGFAEISDGQAFLTLLTAVAAAIATLISGIMWAAGSSEDSQTRSSGESSSDRVASRGNARPSGDSVGMGGSSDGPRPSERPSVGSTPSSRPAPARPASDRPAQNRPAQNRPAPAPAPARLPSARNLDKRALASWLSGRDAARSTSAAQEIIRREVVGDFAAQFISILQDNPSAIVEAKTRVAMIDAMGNRRPNAAGSAGLSKALLAVIDRASSPDEVAAASRALLKVGDGASIGRLGELVEQDFVNRYERGNGVRADVARGVMQHMENLRSSGADPNGPAYKRINDVLSRKATNPLAANAATLSREVYARNPRYVPSAYDRRRYNDDDDFWTAYWVSGVMGFPYPSNYGMMFYFMHQMNAAQAGAPAPTFWEIQRHTYDDYSNGNLGSSGSFGNSAPSDNYGFPAPSPSSGADASSFGGNADLAPPPADSLQRAATDSAISSGADASSFGLGDFSQAAPASNGGAPASGAASSGSDASDFGAGGNNDATREPSRDSGVGSGVGAAIGSGAASSGRNDDIGSSREDTSR